MTFKELFRCRDEAALRQSIATTLSGHDLTQGVWIFGYGSLVWNPEFCFAESRVAWLEGFHRRLCVQSKVYRGTPDCPGLVLGLAPGGQCEGRVFRIAPQDLEAELLKVWEREMFDDSYVPAWIELKTEPGTVEALTFVVNQGNELYVPELSLAQLASTVASASGERGSCEEYLNNTVEALKQHGLPDRYLETVLGEVQRLRAR